MESGFLNVLGLGLFLFGLIIGSFLNVLVLRYHSGRTLSGRSGCLSCNAPLSALELVPVLSYLFLRGRCRSCRSVISPQYPLVEFSTALLFLGAMTLFDFSYWSLSLLATLFAYLTAVSALVALVAYDLKHKIIPDAFVLVFALSALLLHLFNGESLTRYLLAALILAFPFAAIWYFSRGKFMGLGDAKLAFGIGSLLGLSGGLTAIIFGFWIGAVSSLFILFISHIGARLSSEGVPLTMKSEVPFAPFLALGLVIELFTHLSLFDFSLLGPLF